MNRRAFLLGCIAAPIATKVDAVSAALRPIATIDYNSTPILHVMDWDMEYFQRKIIEAYGLPIGLLNQPPLDSRREPWHDGKAGRDQIG